MIGILFVIAGVAGYYVLGTENAWLRWGSVVAGLVLGGGGGGVLRLRHAVPGSSWMPRASSCARSSGRRARRRGKTTLVVFVFVAIAGVFFWVLDLAARLGDALSDRAGELIVALRWYVVHAYSNFEHRVAESLKERIKRAGLEAKFGEILVPTEEVVEMRDGQKRKSERKFYPGYVLVQMEMDEETWHLVRDVPKVLGLHRRHAATSRRPITDKEANQILRRVEEGVDKPRPKVLFEPGEVVRVITGRSTTSTASSRA